MAGGQPLRLTTGNSGGDAAWTQDGKEIVFDSPNSGVSMYMAHSCFRGAAPTDCQLRGMPMSPRSHAGGTSSLTGHSKEWDTVWRLDLKDKRHALAAQVQLMTGRRSMFKPMYSPDGKKIAFESNRMG